MTTTPELRQLLNKATPGPWEVDVTCNYVMDDGANEVARSIFNPEDARLIAAAPDLAAEVLRLREGIKALADAAHEGHEPGCGGALYETERYLRALLDGGDQ